MLATLLAVDGPDTVALTPVTKAGLADWLAAQSPAVAAWVKAVGFTGEAGSTVFLPGPDGAVAHVLAGVSAIDDLWAFAGLPASLPAGSYKIDAALDARAATRVALGWALGSYRFSRYRKPPEKGFANLVWPAEADRGEVERAATATWLVRDLVNTPACDMGPAELARAAQELAAEFDAAVEVIVGQDLLDRDYPAVHAVGRASPREPRLIDLRWGNPAHPKVTIVGKGVCFDTGGLDLKPSSAMLIMKKDMGGAAHALALGRMIMMAGLPVRLRVLVPAVENVVSGDSFKPQDVLKTRKGLTVEVGNTDAEGRLILCDALAEADSEKPELLIDFATLTGAARVALGPDLPALMCNDDALANELTEAGTAVDDPMWRLPLWAPYRKGLDSKVADINNVTTNGFAGAITAGLFLQEFVSKETPWAHLDTYAWNGSARPGRPEGGEALGLRAAYAVIAKRFG
ncbi:leucyl aminopeptidase [Azospirillum lipoferum]|uniref:Leucyl aminopeptidase family protein n=1 Tax=Azospirillum lipoferum TaxID=193 RepID=A0A5A9GTS6_AZOLI|nr:MULTISPECIES: leucyl aminopeptidase family protein [Azospirillum]KAA0597703.1 leucyl aminopeptidase family protein [Azospirillum lipoferum]MCP1610165.1 leucyl aminopeptidase [Azospirillum lipoferum]MDW5534342.1 leucyl aminopeptidase family protein [Azospirillum sp. NL1]